MRLLVDVTTATMTESIAASARSVAAPGTEIIGLTPRFGAESVEGNFESYLAAVAVMDAVARYDGPFDAVVQAAWRARTRRWYHCSPLDSGVSPPPVVQDARGRLPILSAGDRGQAEPRTSTPPSEPVR
jgi:hypothetical protein